MTEAIVEARGLTKHYGKVYALNKVDLDIYRGEWISVMGPSGSGKTTLLNLIGCLDRPSEGQLLLNGVDVTGLNQNQLTRFRRETIGLVFQQFHLVPYLNALENVMLAQYFHSLADEAEARQALEAVGLGDRLLHLPSQLSGGEQQRVCITRALINQPKILLADEPTGNLDKQNEDLVIGLLKKLHQEGHTIIVATHDPEIGQLANYIIRLDHGRISQTITPESDEAEGQLTAPLPL